MTNNEKYENMNQKRRSGRSGVDSDLGNVKSGCIITYDQESFDQHP
jgi:hypothetical protein